MKRATRGRYALGLGAIVATLLSIAPSAGHAADAAAGRRLLEEKCGRCHAVRPGERSAHRQAPPFGVVARRYPPASLAEALAEGIVVGHPDMPDVALPPAEIDDVITYLETLR